MHTKIKPQDVIIHIFKDVKIECSVLYQKSLSDSTKILFIGQ
jgi:hypothetical protein